MTWRCIIRLIGKIFLLVFGVFRNAFMEFVAEATSCLLNTADDIGSFTAVCVVGVLGTMNCEYRQTFVLAMCGIVTFLK